MLRKAPEVLWLSLENEAGETNRMGATSEHPLFLVGDGWTDAGDVTPGDLIRDKDLRSLTVLTVEVDDTPCVSTIWRFRRRMLASLESLKLRAQRQEDRSVGNSLHDSFRHVYICR